MQHAERSTPLQSRVIGSSDVRGATMLQAAEQCPAAHALKVAPGEPLALGEICRQRGELLQQLDVAKAVGHIDPSGINPERSTSKRAVGDPALARHFLL
ncbi:MAG: hypothetical protein AB7S93_16755 [Xanthobacteraceae bacterium]